MIEDPRPVQPYNLKNGRINGRFANPYFLCLSLYRHAAVRVGRRG